MKKINTTILTAVLAGINSAALHATIIPVPLPVRTPVLTSPIFVLSAAAADPLLGIIPGENQFRVPAPSALPNLRLPGIKMPITIPGVPAIQLPTIQIHPGIRLTRPAEKIIEGVIERIDQAFRLKPGTNKKPSWADLTRAFDGVIKIVRITVPVNAAPPVGTQTLPEDDLMKDLGF